MGQPIPAQHPSFVLRSHYDLVRGLLAIAMAAVVALTVAVLIVANDENQVTHASSAKPLDPVPYRGFSSATNRPQAVQLPQQQAQTPAGTRFDGGPEEGTRGLSAQPNAPVTTRFDGGPEEGTRGARSYYESPSQRSSYQPAPADDGVKERAGGPTMMPQGPLSR